VRKAISVIKNRLSVHATSIRKFEITDKGLKIGPPLRQFEGIVSGIPRFIGQAGDLINFADKSGSMGSGSEGAPAG
jgi:circadian clock protein KaiC